MDITFTLSSGQTAKKWHSSSVCLSCLLEQFSKDFLILDGFTGDSMKSCFLWNA